MPIYEYRCSQCQHEFEAIVTRKDAKPSVCPRCESPRLEKKVSVFSTQGRGDVREHTLHGCHEHHIEGGDSGHHDHAEETHDHHHGEMQPQQKKSA